MLLWRVSWPWGGWGPGSPAWETHQVLNEGLQLLLLPTDIVTFCAGVSVTAYYLTPGDESVTHDTECLSPGPGCCTKIISANPDPGPGIAGNFQPSRDVTWSSQSDLGSHYNHSLTKDEAEELQELSQGNSAEGQSRDNARDDVSTNWLESEVSGVGWSGLSILSLNDLSNLKLIITEDHTKRMYSDPPVCWSRGSSASVTWWLLTSSLQSRHCLGRSWPEERESGIFHLSPRPALQLTQPTLAFFTTFLLEISETTVLWDTSPHRVTCVVSLCLYSPPITMWHVPVSSPDDSLSLTPLCVSVRSSRRARRLPLLGPGSSQWSELSPA